MIKIYVLTEEKITLVRDIKNSSEILKNKFNIPYLIQSKYDINQAPRCRFLN